MQKKKTVLILALVFVLLLGGAYLLYDWLGQNVESNQLAVQNPQETQNPVEPQPTESMEPDVTETPEPSQSAEPEQMLAPDFIVYDAQGNQVHLTDYFGKPIVLNFWASWCGPCQMEMPDFQEKFLELGDSIQFLMINVTGGRETLETAMAFIGETGYTFPVLYDLDGDAAMTYGAYSLPTTYFIDAEGYPIAKAVGAIDGATLQQGIDMIFP